MMNVGEFLWTFTVLAQIDPDSSEHLLLGELRRVPGRILRWVPRQDSGGHVGDLRGCFEGIKQKSLGRCGAFGDHFGMPQSILGRLGRTLGVLGGLGESLRDF